MEKTSEVRVEKGQMVYVLPYYQTNGNGRPAIVVSNDWYQSETGNVIVCYLTRNPSGRGNRRIAVPSIGKSRSYAVLNPVTVSLDRVEITDKCLSAEDASGLEAAVLETIRGM